VLNIEVLADVELVAKEAAGLIAQEAWLAVTERGRFIMAVSGGHTPWMMLRALAAEQMPWDRVHVFQVDERVAPAGDPERNLTHLRESLLEHAQLPPRHIHAMPVEAFDLETAAGRCSTSYIWVSDPTVTPLPWCPAIRFWTLSIGMSL
jgi:6-phosphogluconolactonase